MSEQENLSVEAGFPRELLSQPIEVRRSYFENKVIAHPVLKTAYEGLLNAIRQPAGSSLIWAYGPTGVGKTTMLKRVVKQLLEDSINKMELDPGHIPVVNIGLQDVSIERGVFDWKDFFKCIMRAQNEPLINSKISYDNVEAVRRLTNKVSSLSDLRSAARECLHNRRPLAVIIDEAQHFKKVASGKRFLDQMDNIKALAETTEIVHVLIGTYELLELTNLSGQLSRRSTHIHLPRYRCENPKDLEAFKNMLMMFQRHLPLPNEPNFVDQYEYFYDGCVGCIGVLKDWLRRAFEEALESNDKTLTMKCLKNHEKSTHELMNMIREISLGEQSLRVGPKDRAELRTLLGWDKVAAKKPKKQKSEVANSEQDEQAPEEQKSEIVNVEQGEQTHEESGPDQSTPISTQPELQSQEQITKQSKPKQKKGNVGQRKGKRDLVGE